MLRKFVVRILVVAFALVPVSARAWWDGGHMQIAYLAYTKLTPSAKGAVDRLIALNPDYSVWIAGTPADQVPMLAFVRAAVWADDIKEPGHDYINDGETPSRPEAGRNIGYADKLMHKYWHFKDIAFSTDGTPLIAPDEVNALTQIKLFMDALPSSSGASDDIRSYDLAWLLHLVADVHQPLHATTRVSQNRRQGDRGGNAVMVRPATGEVINLHAYWDRMFGGYSTPRGAVFDATARDGLVHVPVDPGLAAINDPEVWLKESCDAAQMFAYAEPVLSGTEPVELTRAYETAARTASRARAALAAQRLANLLNRVF
jgi:hypothetical protein